MRDARSQGTGSAREEHAGARVGRGGAENDTGGQAGGTSKAAGRGSLHGHRVCGIDAEWQPYSPNIPRSPVSTLQLSSRTRCFVVDMLVLCHPPDAVLSVSALSVRLAFFQTMHCGCSFVLPSCNRHS